MSAGVVTAVALLGGLAGGAAPALARRFTSPRHPRGAAPPRPPDPQPASPGGPGPPPSPGRPLPPTLPSPAGPRPPTPPDLTGPGRQSVVAVLAGAVVFGGLAADRGTDPALPALLLVAAVGLVLVRVDLACLRLPDPLVAAVAGGGGLGLVGAALATGASGRLLPALAGAALSFTGYVVLALLPGSRLGFGDVKLAAALGLPLGWLGWPALGLGLLLPHLLNGVAVLALLATRRVRRDTLLPFGPAILAGAWLAVLLG